MMNIVINSQCSRVLTADPDQERELIDFLRSEIKNGTWTLQTPCVITEGGETIDRCELQDIFNL